MQHTLDFINRVLNRVVIDAEICKTNAAYSGSPGDGGYTLIMRQVNAYQHGLAKTIPADWTEYVKMVEREIKDEELRKDPEYAEYIRLSKKFGQK